MTNKIKKTTNKIFKMKDKMDKIYLEILKN